MIGGVLLILFMDPSSPEGNGMNYKDTKREGEKKAVVEAFAICTTNLNG